MFGCKNTIITLIDKIARRMSEGLYVLLVSFFDTETLISQRTGERGRAATITCLVRG